MILTVWNPASLALYASSSLPGFSTRSPLSLVHLGLRIAMTGVGVAAGIALWLRRPGAVWLAQLALTLFAIEACARLSTGDGLPASPPATRLTTAVLIVVHNAAWFLYLRLSGRVRTAYGLESSATNRRQGTFLRKDNPR